MTTTRVGLKQVAGKDVVCSECGARPKRQPARVDKRFQITGEQWWCYAFDAVHCQACCSCVGWGPPPPPRAPSGRLW